MDKQLKPLTDFLVELGAATVPHTKSTFLAHLIADYHLMQRHGCTEEVCHAGIFHSIYGTELFQGFKLPLERRDDVRRLIGQRAEKLAYINCVMDRASFDRVLGQAEGPYRFVNRLSGEPIELDRQDFDDLCRVHLFDFLEQVPRVERWNYRRAAYRQIADRLGGEALAAYDRVFAAAPAAS